MAQNAPPPNLCFNSIVLSPDLKSARLVLLTPEGVQNVSQPLPLIPDLELAARLYNIPNQRLSPLASSATRQATRPPAATAQKRATNAQPIAAPSSSAESQPSLPRPAPWQMHQARMKTTNASIAPEINELKEEVQRIRSLLNNPVTSGDAPGTGRQSDQDAQMQRLLERAARLNERNNRTRNTTNEATSGPKRLNDAMSGSASITAQSNKRLCLSRDEPCHSFTVKLPVACKTDVVSQPTSLVGPKDMVPVVELLKDEGIRRITWKKASYYD